MNTFALPLDVNESNLVALAIDFYISNIDDLSNDQRGKLQHLLMQFDDFLDAKEAQELASQHHRVEERQGNLLRVDFGKNID